MVARASASGQPVPGGSRLWSLAPRDGVEVAALDPHSAERLVEMERSAELPVEEIVAPGGGEWRIVGEDVAGLRAGSICVRSASPRVAVRIHTGALRSDQKEDDGSETYWTLTRDSGPPPGAPEPAPLVASDLAGAGRGTLVHTVDYAPVVDGPLDPDSLPAEGTWVDSLAFAELHASFTLHKGLAGGAAVFTRSTDLGTLLANENLRVSHTTAFSETLSVFIISKVK